MSGLEPRNEVEKGGSFVVKTYVSVKFDSVKRFRLRKRNEHFLNGWRFKLWWHKDGYIRPIKGYIS